MNVTKGFTAIVITALGTILLLLVILIFQLSQSRPIELIYQTTPQLTPQATATPSNVVIDIEGAVNYPGVYTLPFGARIEDGVKAAGGFSQDAAPEKLAMSRTALLRDEQRITIPKKTENQAQPATTDSSVKQPSPETTQPKDPGAKTNINTASRQELIDLSGVGEKIADKIIQRREQKGSFSTVDTLVEEKILSQSALDKIKEQITV
ncbi:MAG: helix-hairpin-helix domain-containing protein [bacterium]